MHALHRGLECCDVVMGVVHASRVPAEPAGACERKQAWRRGDAAWNAVDQPFARPPGRELRAQVTGVGTVDTPPNETAAFTTQRHKSECIRVQGGAGTGEGLGQLCHGSVTHDLPGKADAQPCAFWAC